MSLGRPPAPPLDPRHIRRTLHLSRERMARLMDVSAKTIERWEERGALPGNGRRHNQLARIQEITELGLNVYTPEGFVQFLATPLPVFEGRTALQMIEQDHADQVLAALAADYEGLGF